MSDVAEIYYSCVFYGYTFVAEGFACKTFENKVCQELESIYVLHRNKKAQKSFCAHKPY